MTNVTCKVWMCIVLVSTACARAPESSAQWEAQSDSSAIAVNKVHPQGSTIDTKAGGGASDDTQRVDNPYVGAKGYVNPEWQAHALTESGGQRLANTPTAVWLDRIAAIDGMGDRAMGLRDHLDAALSQRADYIQFVIYNLPGRDCSALSSKGELGPTELPRYQSDFIEPIAAILGEAKYRRLRIIDVIEPDSLPNLVTNTSVPMCAQMKDNAGYVQGISYALAKLGALPNTYNYLDAGHHNWLGWDQNLNDAAMLFAEVSEAAGTHNVHGFITNTANYSALAEPFIDPNASIDGAELRKAKWISWNSYVDELSFAVALREKLVQLGFDSSIGMLIDTSRNGWGGPNRPVAPSGATDVDTEPPRISRRLQMLRGWSHGTAKQVFTGGSRTCSTAGA